MLVLCQPKYAQLKIFPPVSRILHIRKEKFFQDYQKIKLVICFSLASIEPHIRYVRNNVPFKLSATVQGANLLQRILNCSILAYSENTLKVFLSYKYAKRILPISLNFPTKKPKFFKVLKSSLCSRQGRMSKKTSHATVPSKVLSSDANKFAGVDSNDR